MKICTIVGARPQFIKAATLSRVIADFDNVEEIIVHSGQHYDNSMSDQFFSELSIPAPKYKLNIGSASHGRQTGQMLSAIEDVLMSEKPDWVVVYGDTNTTLAGALAAAKIHIPVAHIEAGLRSFNRRMPEEINRIASDHLSTLLFAPTKTSALQLEKEGIHSDKIHFVGDVMYDAVKYYSKNKNVDSVVMERLGIVEKSYCLATIHRAENTDSLYRLKNICESLIELSAHIQVVLPIHPRTQKVLDASPWASEFKKRVTIIEPLGYLDMLALERNAKVIITDSGGVQKEAYFCNVPCITLRDETEWVELVESGWNKLVSPDNSFSLSHIVANWQPPEDTTYNMYGTGEAALSIINTILGE